VYIRFDNGDIAFNWEATFADPEFETKSGDTKNTVSRPL
jgi:hypothetical protein